MQVISCRILCALDRGVSHSPLVCRCSIHDSASCSDKLPVVSVINVLVTSGSPCGLGMMGVPGPGGPVEPGGPWNIKEQMCK